MSSTPGAPSAQTRRLIHRTALGASLVLALSGVAMAPSQAVRVAAPSAAQASSSAAALSAGTGRNPVKTRHDDGMDVSRAVAAAVQRQMTDRIGSRAAALPNNSIAIPVVAHIIKGKKKRAGHITRAGIDAQIAAMNVAYSGGEAPGVAVDTPFRFYLRKVTKTRNQKWYGRISQTSRAGVRAGDEMKRRLHRGKANTLNLYFVKFNSGLLGYSTFPWNAHGKKLKLDGTVIDYRSRPGGELAPYYNQGDTGVHEVGHWLGLLHTFQGGCAEPNDFVADTPAEADTYVPASGYVDGKDSCLTLPGVDPIHNFMDYAPDPTMNQFTLGQVERMSQAWVAFR